MDQPIDLFKYGVKDTWEKLMCRAYEGEYPEGGYDFPSAAILSKCEPHESDLHVDIINYDGIDFSEFTLDSSLAVLNSVQEEGPATTDNPFEYPPDVSNYPGVFGGALKNFCEARCLLKNGKSDTSGLDKWFADSWGVPGDFDFDYVTPSLRSTGAAMWGGVSRVLKPMNTMLPASVPGLQVTHHGRHRTDYGERTLVDWSRIKAVAQSVVVQMYADDKFAKGQVRRMDYRIVPYNLPEAPSDGGQHWDFPIMHHAKFAHTSYKHMMETIRRAKAKEYLRVEGHLKDGIRVDNLGKIDRIKMAELRDKNVIIDTNFGKDWYKHGVDADLADIAPKKKGFISATMSRYKTQEILLVSRVRSIINKLPRSAQIMSDITETENLGGVAAGFHRNKALVKEVYGHKFLHVTRNLGDLAGRDKGWDWVVDTARECGVTDSHFSHPSLTGIYLHMINDIRGVSALAARVARIVRDVDQWQANNLVTYLGRIESMDASVLVGDVIRKKKRYWVSRCVRNYKGRLLSKTSRDHMIVSQIRAKTLRATDFHVDDQARVFVDRKSHDIAFRKVLDAYIRKRRKYSRDAPVLADDIWAACRTADDKFRLPKLTSFSTMYQHSIDYLEEFRRDIANTIEYLFTNGLTQSPVTMEDAGMLDDTEETGYDSDEAEQIVLHDAEKEEMVKEVTSSSALPDRYANMAILNFQDTMREYARLENAKLDMSGPQYIHKRLKIVSAVGGFVQSVWELVTTPQEARKIDRANKKSGYIGALPDPISADTPEVLSGTDSDSDSSGDEGEAHVEPLVEDDVAEPADSFVQEGGGEGFGDMFGDLGGGGGFLGDDFDMDDMDNPVDQSVDLALELHDDFPLLTPQDIQRYVDDYGEDVDLETYGTISEVIKTVYWKKSVAQPKQETSDLGDATFH